MKWVLFTGTWKDTNAEVLSDVREATREVLTRGDGIITGGALGVDHACMDEVLRLGKETQLKVIIPTKLEVYIEHFHNAAHIGKILKTECELLEASLRELYKRCPEAVIELSFTEIKTREEYFARNQAEVDSADEVYAFQVNDSVGTQDTIDKAIQKGIPISVHKKYTIPVV